jgi:putative endonuclease
VTERQYYIYILTSKTGTLYTGVTGDLRRRVYQHKQGAGSEFTSKYQVNRLIYYEAYGQVADALAREKQIKGWRRQKKIDLIESLNPKWKDLSEE